MTSLSSWSILTWRGRLDAIAYLVRRWFVKPAPDEARCYMGAPVSDDVWCPRFAVEDSLWCKRHGRDA